MIQYQGRGFPAGYEDDSNDEEDFESMEIFTQNLKITVVPNITKSAGLNGEDFDAELPMALETWFTSYQTMWNSYKSTPTLSQNLKAVYMNDENPLLLALKLFANCPGCNNLKNKNLALFVLETICALHKTNPEIANVCTDNMRMVAFNFIKTSGVLPLYQGITTAYQLIKIKDILVMKIQELIDEKRYKDAAYWAIALEATQSFDIYQIVLPLILQNKPNLAVECLDKAKDQQEAMVQFLDSLLDKRKTVIDHCYPIIDRYGYTELNQSIISFRPMSKLVARLAKKYQIDEQLTPNLSYSKSRSYMYYLYKRFKDGKMSRDSFRELVKDAATTTVLKYDLVANISSHGDREEALYWVKLYQIPTDQWPSTLYVDDGEHNSSNDTVDGGWVGNCSSGGGGNGGGVGVDGGGRGSVYEESFSSNSGDASPSGIKEEYLQLELRDEAIILVDRRSTFTDMIKTLEKQSLIGLDSEWKPSACQVETVSLLQLATFDKVYLVDVMSEDITDDLWRLFGRNIFNNLEILKIGFALRQDLIMLQKSLPQMNLCLSSGSCYLDLRDLWNRSKYMHSFNFPYKRADKSGPSLSALTQVCLGKTLDKSNQLSNWAKRPLRRDQIIYAALDAYCLVQIYKVIAECLTRIGYDIDRIVDQITSTNSTKPEKSANKQLDCSSSASRPSRKSSRNTSMECISSTKIKFICDSILGGLLHNLRRLGIDCLEINMRTSLDHYVRKAQQENRCILSRDSHFLHFSKHLPKSLCIEIPEEAPDNQVINVIQYFNITINKNEIITRCPKCNGIEFISASVYQIRFLKYGPENRNSSYTRGGSNGGAACANPVRLIFNSKPITDEVLQTGRTFSSALIKTDKISNRVISSKNDFFICDKCGRITWPNEYRMSPKIANLILDE
ncbi:exonuclease mut-7 homolog isoform X2 [Eupeodes corollae]|uniref:exonuclease mut-7 homolog isoform X2 n=1 Tax=Eupeodes corollae TaxID=290404 RepID=UPI00248F81C2|nr:exonuclease mut-7 homolog isoform X2 [Eupeodes corollae]